MSTYLCDQDTINAIATYAADHGIVADAKLFAELLTLTNVVAMKTRYPGREWLEAEVIIPAEAYRYERVEVSAERAERAASEYDYQACEATDYDLSLCARLVSKIIMHADALAKLERRGGCGADLNDHPFAPANVRLECGGDTPSELRFARFCADVCRCLGLASLDGDQDRDGYSLDWAHDMWCDGATVADCAAEFRALMNLVRPGGCGAERITIGRHVQGVGEFNASLDGRVVACAFLYTDGKLAVHDIVRGGSPRTADDPGEAYELMLAIAKREAAIAELERPGGVGAQRADRWLVELFETEFCAECGGDAQHHEVVPTILGHRFARCIYPCDVAGNMALEIARFRESIDELERPGGVGAARVGVYWTARSVNKKTGPIPVSTTSAETCPSACPLAKGGCYAKGGNVGILWHALTRHGPNAAWKHGASMARSIDWAQLCERVSELEPGTLWRHNQAGDLPHRAQRIAAALLEKLVLANKGRRGFTYTHHEMIAGDTGIWNRALVRWANATGFTVNLSGNDLTHADRLADTGTGPVVVILPQDAAASVATPAGRPVKVCPAVVREGITCATCQWCAMPERKWIVGFPAHGSGARAADAIATKG